MKKLITLALLLATLAISAVASACPNCDCGKDCDCDGKKCECPKK